MLETPKAKSTPGLSEESLLRVNACEAYASARCKNDLDVTMDNQQETKLFRSSASLKSPFLNRAKLLKNNKPRIL